MPSSRQGAMVAACLLLGACGGADDSLRPLPSGAPGEPGSSEPQPSGWLDAVQRRRADQLISVFENSTTEIRYDYAENLDDGRGVTSGRAGFTTATCDALAVIEIYTADEADNALVSFVPELERLCDEGSDDTTGLPEQFYVEAWRDAAGDASFRTAQDEIVDREYYVPAMEAADELGLESALARAQLYDSAIQHGAGDDPDGLYALIERTSDRAGPPAQAGEEEWLDAFFAIRIDDLTNPHNADTADAWRESIDRVECMRAIAAAGNVDLNEPITCTVYGDEFTID